MAKNSGKPERPEPDHDRSAAESQNLPAPVPAEQPAVARRRLPSWNVVLHGDPAPGVREVVKAIVMLTPLTRRDASQRATQAKTEGRCVLLSTHRERAELYVQQFASQAVKVTIEAQ